MERKKLEAGAMYGRKKHRAGAPEPVRLIETARLWTTKREKNSEMQWVTWLTPTKATAPSAASGWSTSYDTGYLAIARDHHRATTERKSNDDLAADMAEIALPSDLTVESVAELRQSLPKWLDLTVVNNRQLTAEWETARAEQAEKDARAQASRDARNARYAAHREQFEELAPRLHVLGVSLPLGALNVENGTVQIGLEELRALAAAAERPSA